MKKLMRWLHWLMVPPFGLFLYVGAKGCLFLLATRYGEDAALALMLAEFIFGGVVSVAAILALCYAIAPQGKIAAVIVTGLFCVAFNGYFEVWRAYKAMTDTPLWHAGTLTGLSFLALIIVCVELRAYQKRKAIQSDSPATPPKEDEAKSNS